MSANTNVGNLSVGISVQSAQLQAGLAAAVAQTQAAGAQMQSAIAVQPSSANDMVKHRNFALLQASRGLQDFQAAGLMGVVNNVEGVAMSVARAMGKSTDAAAGFAGKLTLVAVAVQVIMPLVQKAVTEISSVLGLIDSNLEKAQKSVKGMMGGGMAINAIANAHKTNSEFLQSRDDTQSTFSFLQSESSALANNMRRALEATAEMSKAMQMSAIAAKEMKYLSRGSTAENDQTTQQQADETRNKALFQSAVNLFGGGDNLRTKVESEARRAGMNKAEARTLYGGFAEGDIGSTNKIESLIDLGAERAKLNNQDIERNMDTLKAQFLEEETIRKEYNRDIESNMNEQIGVFKAIKQREEDIKGLQDKAADVRGRISDLMDQRARSEIVGASDVFGRNLNAGQNDPVVIAIEKQTEELKTLTREIATLG